jgi:AraC-like DNA-binding protein
MLFSIDDRLSTSPFVERVWRSRSHHWGSFLSLPEGNLELVITRLPGLRMVTLRGPVLRASVMECPPNGEWLAIRFRIGTYLPRLLPCELAQHDHVELPMLPNGRFWLSGLSWELPSWENAEDFVARLATAGVIARSHAADAAVAGDAQWMSKRSVERHIARSTGMSLGTLQQILRVRRAVGLLADGHSILDATFEAGYYDQAHLTRAMKQLIGITPAELVRQSPQISYRSEGHRTG